VVQTATHDRIHRSCRGADRRPDLGSNAQKRLDVDRDSYLALGRVARSAARDVINEENSDWIASIEQL
jgi:hypothetical protein